MTYRATGRKPGRPSNQRTLVEWLQDYINSGTGGMRLATRVEIDGQERGFSLRALKNAKKTLGFTSVRVGGLGSDGDWMWVNPQRLSPNKSITQELAEKLDRHEKRLADSIVTSKAQSRANIANGWLGQVTEEMFEQGKTLPEIRENAARKDPYLTDKNFAEIEEEFRAIAFRRLIDLNNTKTDAGAACESVRARLAESVAKREVTLSQSIIEMAQAKAIMAHAVGQTQDRLAALEQQIGTVLFLQLTRGQSGPQVAVPQAVA